MSESLFKRTSIKLRCNAYYEKNWNSNLFQILTCTYPLKKVRQVEFLIFLTNILKPTVSIWSLITQNKNQNILYTFTQINYMVMQCLCFFQQAPSNE